MQELVLRKFAHVDFRKSEETNFYEFAKTPYGKTLQKGEGVMFISMGNDQYVFVEPPLEFDAVNSRGKKVKAKIIASRRIRIHGTKFSPEMLQKYADEAGYRIVGIKKFEAYLKDRVLAAIKEVKRAA
jgi:hypothetical protein